VHDRRVSTTGRDRTRARARAAARAAVPAHDAVIRRVRALARAADRAAIAGAFVASLGAPPGFWRAPLGALATAAVVPTHRYRPFSADLRTARLPGSAGSLPPEAHAAGVPAGGRRQGGGRPRR
jgi:hypothetical protein